MKTKNRKASRAKRQARKLDGDLINKVPSNAANDQTMDLFGEAS